MLGRSNIFDGLSRHVRGDTDLYRRGPVYGVPTRNKGGHARARRSFTLASPAPRSAASYQPAVARGETVIEYAGNAGAEYAISQMIRENSGRPRRDFTRARSLLFYSLARVRPRASERSPSRADRGKHTVEERQGKSSTVYPEPSILKLILNDSDARWNGTD